MKSFRGLLALGIATTFLASVGSARAEDQIRILCPTWSGYAPIFEAGTNELLQNTVYKNPLAGTL